MIRLFLVLILIKGNFLFGQAELLNLSLLEPNLPIAYRGFENKLVVNEYENDSTIIIVGISDTIKKHGNYYFYTGSPTKTDTLKAYKEGKLIAQKTYTIENLRQPKVYLGSIRDSVVTVEELLKNTLFVISYEPQIPVSSYRVYDFEGSILKKNGKIISLESEFKDQALWSIEKLERKLARNEKRGGFIYSGKYQFSNDQLKHIKKMKTGDILYIPTVTLTCPDCVLRKMSVNLRCIIL